MKAFVASVVVAIVMAFAAAFILEDAGMSSADVYQSSNVRL